MFLPITSQDMPCEHIYGHHATTCLIRQCCRPIESGNIASAAAHLQVNDHPYRLWVTVEVQHSSCSSTQTQQQAGRQAGNVSRSTSTTLAGTRSAGTAPCRTQQAARGRGCYCTLCLRCYSRNCVLGLDLPLILRRNGRSLSLSNLPLAIAHPPALLQAQGIPLPARHCPSPTCSNSVSASALNSLDKLSTDTPSCWTKAGCCSTPYGLPAPPMPSGRLLLLLKLCWEGAPYD